MGKMNWLFEAQLATVVSSVFQIKADDKNLVYFENLEVKGNDYILSSELLTEPEILEVGKILVEVYANTAKDHFRSLWESENVQHLNRNSEASCKFLRAVLSLKGSALHKILLLTSGEALLAEDNVDLLITLAKTKHEFRFDRIDITDDRVYRFLQKIYLLPGVDKRTSTLGDIPEILVEAVYLENLSRLTAFLANDSERLTLKEHLELKTLDAVMTEKSMKDLRRVQEIQRILLSDYRDIAESMTASELVSLSHILTLQAPFGQFSKTILQSRSKAMVDQDEDHRLDYGPYYILHYLSKAELESLSSPSVAKHLNELVTCRDMRAKTQPVVFAALAEVLVVKGEKKAFEVARTLEHLQSSKGRNLTMYEATVAIIAEALKSENNDFPFGWVAQMSEHSWVLTCHILRKSDYELKV